MQLLGENGAGKSTLLTSPWSIHRYIRKNIADGQPANYTSPYEAIEKGVIKVHQEVQVVENLNVAQNIALGFEKTKAGLLDYKDINARVDEILKDLGCSFRSVDLWQVLE